MAKIGRNKASNTITSARNTKVGFGAKSEQSGDAELDAPAESMKRADSNRELRQTKTSGYDSTAGTKQRGGEHYGHRPIVRGTMHRRATPENIQRGSTFLSSAKELKKP